MMGRISSPAQIKAITTVLNDNVRFNKEKKDTPTSKTSISLSSVLLHRR